jgi:hypothetical protein
VGQIVPCGELVQAQPLDEIGFGVDDGDLEIVGVQRAGQIPGGEGSGVSGSENDDAVLHDSLLSGSRAS